MRLTDTNVNQEIKKIVNVYERLYPKNRFDIEDIAQTVICNALRLGVTEFCPAYLKTSIKNEIVNHARSARARVNVSLEDCKTEKAIAGPKKADVLLDVHAAIEGSHLEGKNVLKLYFIDGLDMSEIAGVTGNYRGSVHRKIHRQMKRAKKLLSDYQKHFPQVASARLSRRGNFKGDNDHISDDLN